jgi:ABC-type branched-subunit amino acid transport system substrate-binding protein
MDILPLVGLPGRRLPRELSGGQQQRVALARAMMYWPANAAVQKYLNQKKAPQLFVTSGAARWGDPDSFPWSMGWLPSFQAEGRNFVTYVLRNKPEARIGILYQNDDFGKDYLRGINDALGAQGAKMIVSQQSYQSKRSHHRFPDSRSQGLGRRHVSRYRLDQICGHGYP